jgi:hypothetical protein
MPFLLDFPRKYVIIRLVGQKTNVIRQQATNRKAFQESIRPSSQAKITTNQGD